MPRATSLSGLLALLAPLTSAYAQSVADGPWSGEMRCQYLSQGAGYRDEQLHVWRLTGAPPTVQGAFRQWPATWTASGSGSRPSQPVESWQVRAGPVSAPLAIWEPPVTGRVRIGSQHGLLVEQQGIQLTGSGIATSTFQEPLFPGAEAARDQAVVSGSFSRTHPIPRGWRQPPTVPTVENCQWRFVRGSGDGAPPPNWAVPEPSAPLPPVLTTALAPNLIPLPTFPSTPPNTNSPPAPPPAPTIVTPSAGVATGIGPLPAIPVSSPPANSPSVGQPPANQPVAAATGSYRITINELICVQPTADNVASFDGQGDEIYASAFVRRIDRRTRIVLESRAVASQVYGDTHMSSRIKAGSQSGGGGIRAGDTIPDDGRVGRLQPPLANKFPMLVWQGDLRSDIDALILSLAIWESDGRNQPYVTWTNKQTQASFALLEDNRVLERIAARGPFTPLVLGDELQSGGAANIVNGLTSSVAAVLTLFPAAEALETIAGGADRPVGMRALGPGNTADFVLPNTTLVLTREIIEAALAGPHASVVLSGVPGQMLQIPGPGFLVIHFTDGNRREWGPANYAMVVQVERMQGSALYDSQR